MTKQTFPPSLSRVPGKSDAEIQEERTLRQLHNAISKLAHRSANFDPTADAHYLYDTFLLARSLSRQKRKDGTASPAGVAKHLKQLASGSATLARRFGSANRNIFEAWVDASEAGYRYR